LFRHLEMRQPPDRGVRDQAGRGWEWCRSWPLLPGSLAVAFVSIRAPTEAIAGADFTE
jgi:hypothetical protein